MQIHQLDIATDGERKRLRAKVTLAGGDTHVLLVRVPPAQQTAVYIRTASSDVYTASLWGSLDGVQAVAAAVEAGQDLSGTVYDFERDAALFNLAHAGVGDWLNDGYFNDIIAAPVAALALVVVTIEDTTVDLAALQ